MARRPESTDAAFLLAVAQPLRRRVRLSSAIGRFDFIQHAIATRDEVEGAVRRLSGRGLLEVDGERLRVTERGRELVKRALASGPLPEQVAAIERELRALPADEADAAELPEGEYERAVEAYLRRQDYFRKPS